MLVTNSNLVTDKEERTDTPSESQDELAPVKYPSGPILVIIVIALMLSMFLSIISTAIPKITTQFNSMEDIGWYGSSFFLTLAAFQSAWGHVYKGFSLRGSFLAAIGIFEIGSLVCALAPNSTALIVGRAIQGMGEPVSLAAFIAPPKKVPILIGLLGSTFSVASIAGPLLGGAFSQHVTWRWCFYINLPIGGVAAGVLLFFFRTPDQAKSGMGKPLKEKLQQFDFIGLVVLLAGLICFFLALQWGGVTKPWSDGSVITCLVLWVVLTGAFLGIEWWQQDRALMVPRLLANRNIGACCAFIFFLNAANFSLIYNLPIYFQAINGDSPMASGIKNIPTILSTSIATFLSSAIVTKVGYYQPFLLAGSILATIGAGLIYTFDLTSGLGPIIGYQILYGTGTGLSVQIPVVVAGALSSIDDQAITMATVLFFQFISAAYGVGSTDSIMNNLLLKNIPKYMKGINPEEVIAAGSSGLEEVFSGSALLGARRSYLNGLHGSWAMGIALFGVTFLCALIPKRGGKVPRPGEQGGKDDQGNFVPMV
ncbi:Major facilitator superfamily domain general substrate transporter [Penicillium verrucosum]|uniref:Major facilitator superfamily domain general substrate transporter n=1 Tax=Penicillium verrucosum TaxID=60171 RepID=UPI002545AD9F|nr:Major facilitator superfamily domain general substrate transporter [Penicillium verrucosum]KAJ5931925.1 Major facilitator superfamily domain general substrate transporter [Penicillium verrucosum]